MRVVRASGPKAHGVEVPQARVGEEDRRGPGQQVAAQAVHNTAELEDRPCHWLVHPVPPYSPALAQTPTVRDQLATVQL